MNNTWYLGMCALKTPIKYACVIWYNILDRLKVKNVRAMYIELHMLQVT